MLRILALLTFVAALALGQSGRIAAEAAAVSGGGHIVSAASTDIFRPGTADPHSEKCPASQGANHTDSCHASAPAPAALGPAGRLLDGDRRIRTAFRPSGPELPSLPFKRDPPIPRTPV